MYHVERTCMFDPSNRLTMHLGEDADLALQTYRMTADDFKMHANNATMRTERGGGRYTTYITDDGWEYNKSLYSLTRGLFRHSRQDITAPSLFKGITPNTLTPETPIEMIQFPSDDGGATMGIRLLKDGLKLGVGTFNTDDRNKTFVPVWLGDGRNYELMNAFWESAVKTFDYHTTYHSGKGFVRDTVPYGQLVM